MNYKNFDRKSFKEEYEEIFDFKDEMIDVAQKKGAQVYYLFKDAYNWIIFKIVNNESDIEELKEYFKICCQAIVAYYQLMIANGKLKKVVIADKEVELSNESISYSSPIYISPGIDIALICRNNEAIEFLINIPDEIVFRNDRDKVAESSLDFILFNKIILNEKIEEFYFEELLTKSKEKSKSNIIFFEKVRKPFILLMKALAYENKADFVSLLILALNDYSSYYDTIEDNRNKEIAGWLPLHLIGISSLAYDRGFTIDIDHPLLPMFLVKGEVKVPTLKG